MLEITLVTIISVIIVCALTYNLDRLFKSYRNYSKSIDKKSWDYRIPTEKEIKKWNL